MVQGYSKYGRLMSDEKRGNAAHLVEGEPQRLLAPRLSG